MFLETLEVEIDKKPLVEDTTKANVMVDSYIFMRAYDKYYVERFNSFFKGKYAPIKSLFAELDDVKALITANDDDMKTFIKLLKAEKEYIKHIAKTGELELDKNGSPKDESVEEFMVSRVKFLRNSMVNLVIKEDLKKFLQSVIVK